MHFSLSAVYYLIVFVIFLVTALCPISLLERVRRAELALKELKAERENKIQELNKVKTELEETKDVLKIKVKARIKELEGLTESLEEKVQERTKEIQERMVELERFQKLAVGRELKMIELKKEIERLKNV